MYSQNNEELFIVNYFKNYIGRFLDIGAYDGKTFSNTYKLVELGWSGICIEPSPIIFKKLVDLHKTNTNIINIQVAISKNKGNSIFYESNGDAVSTLDINHKNKWENGSSSKFTKMIVETTTMLDIFTIYGYNFDFINLDVESLNMDIFYQFDFNLLKNLKLICIEHDNKISEIINTLSSYGFTEITRNGENIILGK